MRWLLAPPKRLSSWAWVKIPISQCLLPLPQSLQAPGRNTQMKKTFQKTPKMICSGKYSSPSLRALKPQVWFFSLLFFSGQNLKEKKIMFSLLILFLFWHFSEKPKYYFVLTTFNMFHFLDQALSNIQTKSYISKTLGSS